MSKGKLDAPNLDDRKWQDIVDEAKALIPKYAPEWTDHNPSDPGITLIELFAWIVEGMIYRLNKVPERNFIEFLNLLGITRDPATPASTFLTYGYSGTSSTNMLKGSQVATQQTEKNEGIVFETDRDLIILPINLKTALFLERTRVIPFGGSPIKFRNVSANLISSPLSGMNVNLARFVSYNIFLGFDSGFDSLNDHDLSMLFSFLKPAKKDDIQISWQYSSAGALQSIPISSILDGTNTFQKNGSVTLTFPANANWTIENMSSLGKYIPNSPADTVNQPLFWLVIVIQTALISPIQISIEHILFNTVPATNALTTTQPEMMGVSNGKPFQFFELKNRPLFKKPGTQDPYEHLEIQVREPEAGGGFKKWIPWYRKDDFPEGPGKYYRLNPVTGTINFGNFELASSPEGHGKIPPQGSEIRAFKYRYVIGGKNGNVPPDTIKIFRTNPISGSVTNLMAARGGSDEEDIEETKRRGPETLRNRYRAITIEDYEYLAREATTDVKKVRCLPPRLFSIYDELPSATLSSIVGNIANVTNPSEAAIFRKGDIVTLSKISSSTNERATIANISGSKITFINEPLDTTLSIIKPLITGPWTYGGLNRDTAVANVIVIPEAPLSDPAPMPSEQLLQEVSDYLEERRSVTASLYVTFPRYLPIKVTVNIKVWKKAVDTGLTPNPNTNQLRNEIKAKIEKFLHPILGGPEGQGWEVGQDITISGLFDYIKPNSDIGFISDLGIQVDDDSPHYVPIKRPFTPATSPGVWVRLADYEIVCSAMKKSPGNKEKHNISVNMI